MMKKKAEYQTNWGKDKYEMIFLCEKSKKKYVRLVLTHSDV